MALEIETKYLIRENSDYFFTNAFLQNFGSPENLIEESKNRGDHQSQGYLSQDAGFSLISESGASPDFKPDTMRLRKTSNKETGEIKYFFNAKSKGLISREEFEIRLEEKLFKKYWKKTSGKRIEKIRLKKPYGRFIAEIDIYIDRDLIVAEIEAESESALSEITPLGVDISANPNYKNKNLAR